MFTNGDGPSDTYVHVVVPSGLTTRDCLPPAATTNFDGALTEAR